MAAMTTGMTAGESGSSTPILVKPLRSPSGGLAAGLSGGIPGLEIPPGTGDVFSPPTASRVTIGTTTAAAMTTGNSNMKESNGIKSPQIPFGEGVAVATSAAS
ncbi:hypothetical protein NLI96_g3339 [Meripilus lineatus]|uniref:Uncharacterized protein n=1 Tax=Meripilus lineatus TaxID=2056292 RepID=A0AAD5V955_9APHY|nr:hypothetical protein NLI96_g3339 [Physisporinus lineatus]